MRRIAVQVAPGQEVRHLLLHRGQAEVGGMHDYEMDASRGADAGL